MLKGKAAAQRDLDQLEDRAIRSFMKFNRGKNAKFCTLYELSLRSWGAARLKKTWRSWWAKT